MKYYIRTTHNLDRTPKEFSYDATEVWKYADIGFVGHMLNSNKFMSITEVHVACSEYAKQENERPLSIFEVEAALIILTKFGFAEELQ
jgi:hypothetical protein